MFAEAAFGAVLKADFTFHAAVFMLAGLHGFVGFFLFFAHDS